MNSGTKRKLQIIGIITGVTVGVCLFIKYLLPLVAPFVFAFLIALLIDKPVGFMVRKLRWKRIVCVMVMIVVVFSVVGGLAFVGGNALVKQVRRLGDNYGRYVDTIDNAANMCCDNVDRLLSLENGTSYEFVRTHAEDAVDGLSETIVPTIMHRSMDVASGLVWFFTTLTLVVMGTVFFSKDMEKTRSAAQNSVFKDEIDFIGIRMKEILGTYFKTQFIIMSITCGLCTLGLYLLGNPYAFLIGILIGIVDALPVFGTGTVFLPWSVILLIMGKYKMAAGIILIYVVCYYVRQFLEPKLMGNRLGVSPTLMLISLYLGLVLFGISGVITGPIGAIFIKEISSHLIKNL